MTSTSGITKGLPPLPKSLNSLWSIGKESLSKAEASLGLKATTSASSTNIGKIINNFQIVIENQDEIVNILFIRNLYSFYFLLLC